MLRPLLSLFLLLTTTACEHRNIYQVVKDLAEAPADTTGLADKTIQTNAFSSVSINGFADVTVHQTANADTRVRLQAPQQVMQHLEVSTADDELVISIDRRYRMPQDALIVVDLYAPFLNKIDLNGGKCLRLGTLRLTSPLTIETNGIAAITADSVVAGEVELNINGSGSVDLKHVESTRLNATANGQARLFLHGLKVKTLHTTVNGSGDVTADGRADSAHLIFAGSGKAHIDQLQCNKKKVICNGEMR